MAAERFTNRAPVASPVPCDCPGGIIADNRFPIYDPKPTVRFDMSKAPPPGTQVYVRIRPIASRPE